MEIENKPWGKYKVLINTHNYKVTEAVVRPEEQLSLQYRNHTAITWTIVQGSARIRKGHLIKTVDGDNLPYNITIPKGEHHMIENIGDDELVFIEVQTGTNYLDDLIIVEE